MTGPENCCSFIAKRSAAVLLISFAGERAVSADNTSCRKSKAEGCTSGSKRRARATAHAMSRRSASDGEPIKSTYVR